MAAASRSVQPSRVPAPAPGADGSFRLRPPAAPTSGARLWQAEGGSGLDAPPLGAEPLLSRDCASSRTATLTSGPPVVGTDPDSPFLFFSLSADTRRSRPAVGAAEEGDSSPSHSGSISTRQVWGLACPASAGLQPDGCGVGWEDRGKCSSCVNWLGLEGAVGFWSNIESEGSC